MDPCIVNIFQYISNKMQRYSLFISGNCSTCFGWYLHPPSGAHTTVSTASGICQTVTATCRYRGRVGTLCGRKISTNNLLASGVPPVPPDKLLANTLQYTIVSTRSFLLHNHITFIRFIQRNNVEANPESYKNFRA
jgi:hypothetical protein